MSDTEDGSDAGDDGGFDKEAERERLREKYEQDRKQREATQQMSELLLKGATMTNQHCEDCGSPVFRYEGEAFCPTCAGTRDLAEDDQHSEQGTQQPSEADRQGGQDTQQPPEAGQQGEQGGQRPTGADQQGGRSGKQADSGRQGAGDAGESGQPGPGDAGDTGAGRDAGRRAGGQPGGAGGRQPGRSGADAGGDAERGDSPRAAPDDAPADGELDEAELDAARARLDERAGSRSNLGGTSDAGREPTVGDSPVRQGEVPSMDQTRASLRRAIVSLSEQAAQSDDPTRAHDLLKGAREASEALAALEGTTGE